MLQGVAEIAKLTAKQRQFVAEYLVDFNATAAARRAGYSVKTADRIGPELLGKTCVSAAIQEAIRIRQERTEITQDYVVRKLKEITDMDASDVQDSDLEYANKIKALELLGKHVGAWEPKETGPKDGVEEDDLSRSLRELGKELESDE